MTTKICGKCKQEKPLDEFHANGLKLRSRCKSCANQDTRLYGLTGYYRNYHGEYDKQPVVKERRTKRVARDKWRPDIVAKNAARTFTNHEIRAGRLTREPCSICGQEPGEAHHEDYSHPEKIRWLCKPCHVQAHLKAQLDICPECKGNKRVHSPYYHICEFESLPFGSCIYTVDCPTCQGTGIKSE